MRTLPLARTFAALSLAAASCQSDMPSIKRSELVILSILVVLSLTAQYFQVAWPSFISRAVGRWDSRAVSR
jgi:hypothetical protein